MKKIVLWISFLLLTGGSMVLAQNPSLKGLRFVAPSIFGEPDGIVADPERGEIVFDATNNNFRGYNGTSWNIMDNSTSSVPVGTISAFAGDDPPAGWVFCDGSGISRSAYASLFAVIGTRFGNGDGSTTFNVPDLRGRFLRGTDNMGVGPIGRDPDANSRAAMNPGGATGNAVGSVQSDAFKSHSHTFGVTRAFDAGGNTGGYLGKGNSGNGPETSSNTNAGNGGIANSGGSETRPTNAYVNYIIKI